LLLRLLRLLRLLLQVKYMDLLMQRGKTTSMLSSLVKSTHHKHLQDLTLSRSTLSFDDAGGGTGGSLKSTLSPQHISDINSRASKAFQQIGKTGSTAAYTAIMTDLYRSQVIDEVRCRLMICFLPYR
jgi:hypothetical protein